MADPSELTEQEREIVANAYAAYKDVPHTEKHQYRDDIAAQIYRARGGQDNPYAVTAIKAVSEQ